MHQPYCCGPRTSVRFASCLMPAVHSFNTFPFNKVRGKISYFNRSTCRSALTSSLWVVASCAPMVCSPEVTRTWVTFFDSPDECASFCRPLYWPLFAPCLSILLHSKILRLVQDFHGGDYNACVWRAPDRPANDQCEICEDWNVVDGTGGLLAEWWACSQVTISFWGWVARASGGERQTVTSCKWLTLTSRLENGSRHPPRMP